MRLLIATACAIIAASSFATTADAQQSRKKQQRPGLVVDVTPRSFLDAGKQPQPGQYQNYSLGQTPFRPSDSIVPTGSAQQRLLPGPYGISAY